MSARSFGTSFSPHVVTAEWTAARGWGPLSTRPYADLALSPASMALHYGQAVFEGVKAYARDAGRAALFMVDASAARFARSARRLAMPELPAGTFVRACHELVAIDMAHVPTGLGSSLYLRPLLIATEAALGVRAADEYALTVLASPVGGFFRDTVTALDVWCPPAQSRAAPGGTGSAKCAGNYAGSLLAKKEAAAMDCHEVLWLDAECHRYVEELSAMNFVCVLADGTVVTPPLGDTILAGNTRACLLQLATEAGMRVLERPISVEELLKGGVTEAFACGTAAGVVPIATVSTAAGVAAFGRGSAGPITQQLRTMLTDVQTGRRQDSWGWVHTVG